MLIELLGPADSLIGAMNVSTVVELQLQGLPW